MSLPALLVDVNSPASPHRSTGKIGTPHLAVHHVRRLSDDGPDDPRIVATIDPTVHREIHHGGRGKELNDALALRLKEIEP